MAISAKAQMGYQVALLNKANGKPRANVTVSAQVSITNAKDEVIFSSTQQATSNDFGILSLTVGDANTFKNADFGKLPFFISVTVDGTLISKSQILSVPVAEAAKTLVPSFAKENLVGTWSYKYTDNVVTDIYHITFNSDYTYTANCQENGPNGHYLAENEEGTYSIEGNNIYLIMHHTPYGNYPTDFEPRMGHARYVNNQIVFIATTNVTARKIYTKIN